MNIENVLPSPLLNPTPLKTFITAEPRNQGDALATRSVWAWKQMSPLPLGMGTKVDLLA